MSTPPAWANSPTAIVTGGASGIGFAIAHRLAQEGATVAVFDNNLERAMDAAEKICAAGATARGVFVDVTDRSAIDRGVGEVCRELGRPTILVNSAGLDGFEAFLDITGASWRKIVAVNLTGTFDCCQAVVPHMIEAKWGASSTSRRLVPRPATRS